MARSTKPVEEAVLDFSRQPAAAGVNVPLQVLENKRKKLVDVYKNEEKISVNVSPLYQPYFGRVMQVQINGISIAVPIDGTTHKVPKTFASEIYRRISYVDAIIQKGDRMADVSKNFERYPGELQMF